MSPHDRRLAQKLEGSLIRFSREIRRLPGIQRASYRRAFVGQLIDSYHRVRYVFVIRERNLSPLRMEPSSPLFDPLKAAILYHQREQFDEACWLTFLSVHFGKNLRTGWRLLRDVYGGLGTQITWSWAQTSGRPEKFRAWLAKHEALLEGEDGVARHFGNHRKYQSLSATSLTGTGAAIESYVRWVGHPRTHSQLFQAALAESGQDSRKAFDLLYRSLNVVVSFGRMARFDYLTMVGKLGLAQIEPPSTYMQGATGPLVGSKLLFANDTSAKISKHDIEVWLSDLERVLQLPFGMQVLEDAICNWQKSPNRFKRFRG